MPDALRSLREERQTQPPAFNRTRAAVMAFLRDRMGKRHTLYLAVASVTALAEVRHQRAAPTIAKAIAVRDALTATASAVWWSMYTTGMGRSEYDGRWEVTPGGVAIHGTKHDARERVVPLVAVPTRRRMGWTQLRPLLDALGVQPYDARRGYAHLMEEAGITRTRRRRYLGHAAGDVTGGYETADLAAFWVSDAERLRATIRVEKVRLAARRRSQVKRA